MKESSFLMSILTQQKRKYGLVNEAFEYFYDKAKNKIKLRSNHNETETIIQIPPYCYGLSLYDPITITNLIKKRFTSDGFYVSALSENILYINWSKEGLEKVNKKHRKKEKKKRKEKNSEEQKLTNMLKNKWKIKS